MPIRITGLNSGLDTEAIISALVSSYNFKTDKYKKAQTKLSWKQDAWKNLNTKIYNMYKSLDGLRFSSGYNLKRTTCSDPTKAKVTATTNAVNGSQKLNVIKTAQAGYLTGGKLDANVKSGTTMAELGYNGGDGKINITMGDGSTKSITVSQGTTINSFVNSLKEAGLNASYDEGNKRFYISSKETGADGDFTITGANPDGMRALDSLKLNIVSGNAGATYQKYDKYYAASDAAISQNVRDALNTYNNALDSYQKAEAQNGNISSAYGYAAAYSAMQKALEDSKLSTQDQEKLTKLMSMGASERGSSVMAADGTVYSASQKDPDGNAVFSDGNGHFIQRVDTYTGDNGNVYKLNEDGTYTANGVTYKKSGEKNADGKELYVNTDDENDQITIEKSTAYYDVDVREEQTAYDKITVGSASYTQDDKGNYIGTDGKTYRRDDASHELVEITVADDGTTSDVTNGKKVAYEDADVSKATKTVYDRQAQRNDLETASDVYDSLKEQVQTNTGMTDEELDSFMSGLSSNIGKVNAFEKGQDEVLDAADPYTKANLAAAVKEAYQNGYNGASGADAVKELTNTYADIISGNKQTMTDSDVIMEEHSLLSSIAKMEDGTDKENAIASFVDQVKTAHEVISNGTAAAGTSDAKKVDGEDAVIMLNGIEYRGSSNSFSINGLTIEAQAVTGDREEDAVLITTQTDTEGLYDKIKDFLTQYNSVINEITALYNADTAKGYEPLTSDEKSAMSDDEVEKWEQKIKDSLLRRDGSLESVMNAMTSSMSKSFEINGKNYSLSSFGISTLGFLNAPKNQQYAYHIDGDEDDVSTSGKSDKLMAALTEDPDSVISFMQKLCDGLYSAVGDKMKASTLSSSFTVYNDKEMASEYSDYTTLIRKWEDKLKAQEDYYYKKFGAMEAALSKFQSQTASMGNFFGG